MTSMVLISLRGKSGWYALLILLTTKVHFTLIFFELRISNAIDGANQSSWKRRLVCTFDTPYN